MWDVVVSLKVRIDSIIENETIVSEFGLDCFAGLNMDEVNELKNVLREMRRWIDLRFPCPSSSVDMKGRPSSMRNTNPQNRPPLQPTRCSVTEVLQFMNFPENFMHDIPLGCSYSHLLNEEVIRMRHDFDSHKPQILDVYQARLRRMKKEDGFVVNSKLSLTDVFCVVGREAYPMLWSTVMKTNTILPTTVSCERCFSVIKRSIHTNMKEATFISNEIYKLHEGDKRREL